MAMNKYFIQGFIMFYFIDALALKGQNIGRDTGSHVFLVCKVLRSLTFQQITLLSAILFHSSNRRRAMLEVNSVKDISRKAAQSRANNLAIMLTEPIWQLSSTLSDNILSTVLDDSIICAKLKKQYIDGLS
jgi:hypothetical protein